MKKKVVGMALVAAISLAVSGCTEANNVSYNISLEADNFNVLRRFAVI